MRLEGRFAAVDARCGPSFTQSADSRRRAIHEVPRATCQEVGAIGYSVFPASQEVLLATKTPSRWVASFMSGGSPDKLTLPKRPRLPESRGDWVATLMQRHAEHQGCHPIAGGLCGRGARGRQARGAGGARGAAGREGPGGEKTRGTKRRRTREGGPPPGTRAATLCRPGTQGCQPPR